MSAQPRDDLPMREAELRPLHDLAMLRFETLRRPVGPSGYFSAARRCVDFTAPRIARISQGAQMLNAVTKNRATTIGRLKNSSQLWSKISKDYRIQTLYDDVSYVQH